MSNPYLDAARAIEAALAEMERNLALDSIAEQAFSAQLALAQIAATAAADNPPLADAIVKVADLLTDTVGTARRLAGHPEPPPTAACFHAAPGMIQ